ncbi:MAG: hypothetical protein RIC32_00405 [Ekhidna sp.]
MNRIIVFLIVCLFFLGFTFLAPEIFIMPSWYTSKILFINSALMGSLGGILYCLRGVYLNKSVHKRWDKDWHVWYYLRPLTSLISGLVSSIFLRAGLLVLDAVEGEMSFGYLAVAFIAGYNVDNFLKKIEDVAKTIWGIDKSRSSKNSEDKNS